MNDPRTENDPRIEEALRSLPRETAGAEFTARILQRLNEPPRETLPVRWTRVAALAAIVLCVLGLGWRTWLGHHHEQQTAEARFELLLAEKKALEAELRSLRRMTEVAQPVYLGSNNNVDWVLDLARFHRRGAPNLDPEFLIQSRPADLPSKQRAVPRTVVY